MYIVLGVYNLLVFDENSKLFLPGTNRMGIYVVVRDPSEDILISRVKMGEFITGGWISTLANECLWGFLLLFLFFG